MSQSTIFHGARKVDVEGVVDDFWMLVRGDTIAQVGAGAPPPADVTVDLTGRTITPGFIDLHCHGGGGHTFDDGDDEIMAALATHRAHGTTRSVISVVSNPIAMLRSTLETVAEIAADDPLVLGAHLEGPYLATERRGAHHPDHLREVDAIALDTLIGAGGGAIRQVTLAPEGAGAMDAIDRLVGDGIVVALGHTDCDYETARRAFDRGATLLTHAFNGMRGIHHRAPGPVTAALFDERVRLELVLDGVHVHPDVARLAFLAAPGRIALVTDAMAAAGSSDGDYRLGSLNVSVRNGRALLSGTSTMAGSTLTQDAALRCAIEGVGLDPVDAVAALTWVPAQALALGDSFGRLAPGCVADVVVMDADWKVENVWAAGLKIAG